MTPSAVAFLGAIAVATVVMALIQVGAIVYAARLARRVDRLATRVEQDIQPMIERLTTMSGEAARAAHLAAGQVERVDRMFALLGQRVDQTAAQLQHSLLVPAREGRALAAGLRAGLGALRHLQRRRRNGAGPFDDEDALFIG